MLLGEWYKNASDHVKITCKLQLKDVFSPPIIKKKVVAINKPNISALAPNEKLVLIKTINHQLLAILKDIDETKNLTIKLADEFSSATAKIIVGSALQFRYRREEEKTGKSQYIRRTSERLQTIKEVCDLLRQLKSPLKDKAEEAE